MGVDPELFIPEVGATRQAKAVCRGRVVQADRLLADANMNGASERAGSEAQWSP